VRTLPSAAACTCVTDRNPVSPPVNHSVTSSPVVRFGPGVRAFSARLVNRAHPHQYTRRMTRFTPSSATIVFQ
jgi:hypothetical protein